MTRPLRVDVADGWYHCMNRGIEKRTIFRDNRDYKHFLELLGRMTERFRVRVHAYCLLGNHYHAIIQTPDANLSQAMQWLGVSYSMWFNTRHDRVGPLFQGRFKSVLVQEGGWVFELSMYVHLNPVVALVPGFDKRKRKSERRGLGPPPTREEAAARLKALRVYKWSSYHAYAGYERGPKWLTKSDILRRGGRSLEDRQRQYRERVRRLLSQGVGESNLEKFREAVGIGSAEFVKKVKRLAGDGMRETEHRGRLRARASFEDVVCAVEELREEPRSQWIGGYGDWGKWMVLRLAREFTGKTLAQLGNEVGGADYAAVGMGLWRFDKRLKEDRQLKKIYATACKMLDVKT